VPIDATTTMAGIIGWPVEHSLSPRMHNAAFDALGLNWAYLAFAVRPEAVVDAVHGLAAIGAGGVNVTIPHKQAVIEACGEVSEAVGSIGACNTLVPDGAGGFRGENTDAEGFMRAIDETAPIDLDGQDVLLLGAGGAARAVAWAVRSRGGRLVVANRTPARAEALGDEAIPFDGPSLRRALDRCPLIVNSTSLGLGSDEAPPELPLDGLGPQHVVNDLVYRPGGTPWLHRAAERGARTVDGLGMLLHQGAAAFEMWTGRTAPVDVMRAALTGA